MSRFRKVWAGIGLAVLAGHAWAQPAGEAAPAITTPADLETPGPELDISPWSLRVEPSVWFVSPGADVTLAGSSNSLGLDRLNVDSPRLSPFGELHVGYERWRFTVSGFTLALEGDASQPRAGQLGRVAFAAGDVLSSSLDVWSADFLGGYRFVDSRQRPRPGGGYVVRATLDALIGARLMNLDLRVRSATGADTFADELFAYPIVGAKGTLTLIDQFDLDAQLTAGGWPGDNSSSAIDVVVGFVWRPIPNLGVQMGYRAQLITLDSGGSGQGFVYDGLLAGLYWGAVLKF